MRQKKFHIIILIAFFLVTCFYCLTTFTEISYGVFVGGWTKYIIAIPFICFLTITTKWTKESKIRKLILGLVIVLIIYSRSISDRIYLGHQVAYTYLGQDAGFEELYLFSNGKCKLTYGGILGVTENHYGTFNIKDTVVLIYNKADLLDLENFKIELKGKIFTIHKP